MADTSLVAAGAAAGTAVMPGIGTAVGAVGGLLLGSMMGGSGPAKAGPEGPSAAAVAVYGSGINADNWAVNFGGSLTASPSNYKPFTATGPTASTAAGQGAVLPASAGLGLGDMGLGQVPSWAWVALAGLVAWRALKSHK